MRNDLGKIQGEKNVWRLKITKKMWITPNTACVESVTFGKDVGRSCWGYLGLSVGGCGQQVRPLGFLGHHFEAVQHRCFAQSACQRRATLKGRSTTAEPEYRISRDVIPNKKKQSWRTWGPCKWAQDLAASLSGTTASVSSVNASHEGLFSLLPVFSNAKSHCNLHTMQICMFTQLYPGEFILYATVLHKCQRAIDINISVVKTL